MGQPNKPCTLGPKHKWEFAGNVEKISVNGSSASFSLKGRYRCKCGARKIGNFQHVAAAAQAPREPS